MLVYAIAGDVANVSQLIPDYASVHNYSLRPSDVRRVNNAQVIFRIDDHMEAMLNTVFDKLPKSSTLISLAEESDIHLSPLSALTKKNESTHAHQHGNVDLHIWTSPENAIKMAKTITKTLISSDPQHAKIYQQNAQVLIVNIIKQSEKIDKELSIVRDTPYIVFHNSWRYFQHQFKLKKPAIIALNEGFIPGVKSIRKTRKHIRNSKSACIFSDPSVSASRVAILTEGYKIKKVEIDSLASGIKLDKNAYVNWMKTMQKKVTGCLFVP